MTLPERNSYLESLLLGFKRKLVKDGSVIVYRGYLAKALSELLEKEAILATVQRRVSDRTRRFCGRKPNINFKLVMGYINNNQLSITHMKNYAEIMDDGTGRVPELVKTVIDQNASNESRLLALDQLDSSRLLAGMLRIKKMEWIFVHRGQEYRHHLVPQVCKSEHGIWCNYKGLSQMINALSRAFEEDLPPSLQECKEHNRSVYHIELCLYILSDVPFTRRYHMILSHDIPDTLSESLDTLRQRFPEITIPPNNEFEESVDGVIPAGHTMFYSGEIPFSRLVHYLIKQ